MQYLFFHPEYDQDLYFLFSSDPTHIKQYKKIPSYYFQSYREYRHTNAPKT